MTDKIELHDDGTFTPRPDEALKKAVADAAPTFEERLKEIVSQIELGMNCQVRIGYSAERGDHFVQIQCWRMDVITKKEGWGFGGKGWPSPHSTRNEIVQMIFGLYKGYWEHEARENFTYRGRRVFGPHMDVDAIWTVANKVDVRSLKHVEDQEPKPYVAANGNRFTAEQAKLITEPLRYDPEGRSDRDRAWDGAMDGGRLG